MQAFPVQIAPIAPLCFSLLMPAPIGFLLVTHQTLLAERSPLLHANNEIDFGISFFVITVLFLFLFLFLSKVRPDLTELNILSLALSNTAFEMVRARLDDITRRNSADRFGAEVSLVDVVFARDTKPGRARLKVMISSLPLAYTSFFAPINLYGTATSASDGAIFDA